MMLQCPNFELPLGTGCTVLRVKAVQLRHLKIRRMSDAALHAELRVAYSGIARSHCQRLLIVAGTVG